MVFVEHTGFEKLTGMQDWVIRSAKRWKSCVNADVLQMNPINRFPKVEHRHRLNITVVKIIKSDLVMKVSKHNRGSILKA
jgi:hypothetical protein